MKKKEFKVGDEIEMVKYQNGNLGTIESSTFHVGNEMEIVLIEIKFIRKVSVTLQEIKYNK